MSEFHINTAEIKEYTDKLRVGDTVYLSGTVYTSRDAAHKRIFSLMSENKTLPYEIEGAVQYYAGPTPTPYGLIIGSCGPTTSSRMDVYSPTLLNMGLGAMIGKGPRSKEVCDAIINNHSVYFCAVGGAGALAAKCITKCIVAAFEDLGCESVKELEFSEFPLTVAIDCNGGNLFNK